MRREALSAIAPCSRLGAVAAGVAWPVGRHEPASQTRRGQGPSSENQPSRAPLPQAPSQAQAPPSQAQRRSQARARQPPPAGDRLRLMRRRGPHTQARQPRTGARRDALSRQRRTRSLRHVGAGRRPAPVERGDQPLAGHGRPATTSNTPAPTGQTLQARIRASGFIPNDRVGYALGENIAWGTLWLGTPRAIVRAWMNSPGHRANILNGGYRYSGDRDRPRGLRRSKPAGCTRRTSARSSADAFLAGRITS